MNKLLPLFILLLFLTACGSELAPENSVPEEGKQELSESTAESLEDVFGGSSEDVKELVPPPSFQ